MDSFIILNYINNLFWNDIIFGNNFLELKERKSKYSSNFLVKLCLKKPFIKIWARILQSKVEIKVHEGKHFFLVDVKLVYSNYASLS